MRFKSTVDAWFTVCALVVPVGILLAVTVATGGAGSFEFFILAFVALVSLGLPIWLLLGTWYDVGSEVLTIRSGPFRWTIPISSIQSIEASRSLIASPALSLDRLRIRYGHGQSILVSPSDAQGFKSALGF